MTLFLLLYLTSALAFSLPPPVTVVATTPSDLTNRNGSQHPTADLLHTQASDNTTLSDPWVICSGDRFGFGMSVMGCASAVFQMDSMTSTEESWGIRRTGSFDHPLPQRWIGASGTCRVDIGLVPGTHFGRASPQDFQKGAAAVLEKCVSQRNPSEGGATVQIGPDKTLSVTVSKYVPKARCSDSTGPRNLKRSCKSIIDSMSVDTTNVPWGNVMYPLPYSVVSADGLCELTVLNNSPGVPEIMAWSQLWSAAVEVAGMCVNVGYRGGIRGDMGTQKLLTVALGATRTTVSVS